MSMNPSSQRHQTFVISIVLLLSAAFTVLGNPPVSQPPDHVGNGNVTSADVRMIAKGLTAPIGLAISSNKSERLCIVDQIDPIRVVDREGDLSAADLQGFGSFR